jgi:hypothetical protein
LALVRSQLARGCAAGSAAATVPGASAEEIVHFGEGDAEVAAGKFGAHTEREKERKRETYPQRRMVG